MPRSFAASTRPWPARISFALVASTGFVKPKRSIDRALALICFLKWARALRGYGISAPVGRCSTNRCEKVLSILSPTPRQPAWLTVNDRKSRAIRGRLGEDVDVLSAGLHHTHGHDWPVC